MDKKENLAGILDQIRQQSPSGFAVALHIQFTASRFLFQTYPQNWVDEYTERGLVMKDPVVRWCFENQGMVRWRDLVEFDHDGVMAEARGHGMKYGVSIAVVDGGTRSMAGCSRPDRDYLDVEMDELASLVLQLHRETAGLSDLAPSDIRALEQMSIRLTRN